MLSPLFFIYALKAISEGIDPVCSDILLSRQYQCYVLPGRHMEGTCISPHTTCIIVGIPCIYQGIMLNLEYGLIPQNVIPAVITSQGFFEIWIRHARYEVFDTGGKVQAFQITLCIA